LWAQIGPPNKDPKPEYDYQQASGQTRPKNVYRVKEDFLSGIYKLRKVKEALANEFVHCPHVGIVPFTHFFSFPMRRQALFCTQGRAFT
jgi:hypothetical protein